MTITTSRIQKLAENGCDPPHPRSPSGGDDGEREESCVVAQQRRMRAGRRRCRLPGDPGRRPLTSLPARGCRSRWDAENAKSQQEWSGSDDAGDAGNSGGDLLKQMGLPSALNDALEDVYPRPCRELLGLPVRTIASSCYAKQSCAQKKGLRVCNDG